MSKIPHLKPQRAIRAIKRAGFEIKKEGAKHTAVIKDDQIVTIIPRGGKVLKKGTLSGIIKDLGMTLDEFLSYL
jgi:predicted RNA binding protein YcfA (HicA-like mRNA interferase family)